MKYLWQLTHDDLDGGACAVVAAHLFPGYKQMVIPCNYGLGPTGIDTITRDLLATHAPGAGEEHVLLLSDILPSYRVCEEIDAKVTAGAFTRVLAYDHHETTRWAADKYAWVFHGEPCGARLLFESSSTLPEDLLQFVYAVDAWDRWLIGSQHRERGERLNLIYREIGFSEFYVAFVDNSFADTVSWYDDLVQHLVHKRDVYIESVLTQVQQPSEKHTDAVGRKFVLLIGGAYFGELSERILQEHPDISYVVAAFPGTDTVSLRSRSVTASRRVTSWVLRASEGSEPLASSVSVDAASSHTELLANVAAYAKIYGGGGHASAAGFSFPLRETLVGMVCALLTDNKVERALAGPKHE
jgi:oligoribonuclease NrnB/cAMP/cGMP phosphodiesterase (DHH superfamily)